MSDPNINQLANVMIKSGKASGEIEETLLGFGVAPCVAREWANEPHRRAVLFAKRNKRKEIKQASKFGGKKEAFRRIIKTDVVKSITLEVPHILYRADGTMETYTEPLTIPGRDFQLHATKGWRNYRNTA